MALYDSLGLAPGVGAFAAVERYLVDHPRREFGSHAYDVREFGLTEAGVRRRFRGYSARYGIEPEKLVRLGLPRLVRVLLTGAAGSIGRVLSVGLSDRGHEVVGLDLVPQPDGIDGAWHTADCADPDAVADVFEAEFAESSLDAVVHMAGHPGELSLPDSLTSHVVTTAALLDAMVEHGVRRLVYGGSNHAVGRTPRAGLPDGLLTAETRLRPDTFYGVAKASAEALMSLYADRHGLDVVAAGSARSGPSRPRPATWPPGSPTTTACGWSRPR